MLHALATTSGCRTVHEPWPTSAWRRASLGLAAGVVQGAAEAVFAFGRISRLAGGPSFADVDRAVARWHDTMAWPQRGLRVGVVNPGAWTREVIENPGASNVEWFAVPGSADDEVMHDARLDAVIEGGPDEAWRVRTGLPAGCVAGWDGLGEREPVTFSSVFPTRMDVGEWRAAEVDAGGAPLARLLVEGVAWLSRDASRLTLRDRFAGRRPVGAMSPASGVRRLALPCDPVRDVAARMQPLLRVQGTPSSVERAAARFLSAWAVTSAWGTLAERRRAAESAVAAMKDEAPTLLRCAAVRLEALDDEGGLELLVRAVHAARRAGVERAEQAAFLAAELDTGRPSSLTTARVAVGVALVASSLDAAGLSFFRDDLQDDLAHAASFVGRDQDRRLIGEVVRRVACGAEGLFREAA